MSREKNLAAAAEIGKRINGLVTDSAVSIVVSANGNISGLGSGTLVAVGDAYFVVSAGHVIRHVKDRTVGIGNGNSKLLPTVRSWLVSGDEEDTDTHDVALYRLTPEEAGRLEGAKFVRIGDVGFDEDLSKSFFVVAGFPAMWTDAPSKADKPVSSRLIAYGTIAYEKPAQGLDKFDAERHFLLSAPREQMFNDTGEPMSFRSLLGHPVDFPDGLRGISGCGVWKLGALSERVAKWGQPQLVGVETAVYSKAKAIRATRWNSVTTLLHLAYPELRAVLKFYVDMFGLRH